MRRNFIAALCHGEAEGQGGHRATSALAGDCPARAVSSKTSTGPAPAPRPRRPLRTASPAMRFAALAASTGADPSARWAASADECVHPDPCAAPSRCRSPGINSIAVPSKNTSVASCRWPPVTTTLAEPSACSARARSSASWSSSPASTRASGRFGVITVATGTSSSTMARRAASSSSTAPDSATITGSITTGTRSSSSSSARATASTVSRVPSIPIFTASTPMSSTTARTCSTMNSAGTVCTPVTPTVFCAVNAAIAVIPCTPQRAKAFRSAWIPAPPPESEPAIDSTAGTGRGIRFRLGARGTRSFQPLGGLFAVVGRLVIGDPDHALAVRFEQRLAHGVLAPGVVVVGGAVGLDDQALLGPAEVGDERHVADAERDVDVGVGEAGLEDQIQDDVLEDAAGWSGRLLGGRYQAEGLGLSSCSRQRLLGDFDALEVREGSLGGRGWNRSVDDDITKEGARSVGVDPSVTPAGGRRHVREPFDRFQKAPVHGGGEVAQRGAPAAGQHRGEEPA